MSLRTCVVCVLLSFGIATACAPVHSRLETLADPESIPVSASSPRAGAWLVVEQLHPAAELIVTLRDEPAALPILEAPSGESTKLGTSISSRYRGVLHSARPDAVLLEIDEPRAGRVTIPRESVEAIDLLTVDPDDSLREGLLYGLFAGAATLGTVGLLAGFQDTDMGYALAVFFAPPVVIGVLADAGTRGKAKQRIYQVPE